MNLDAFAACLADGGITQIIMKDRREGQGLTVRSTPTFFIGERRFVGHRELENEGQAHIRELLGLPPAAPEARAAPAPAAAP
jgi:protein-disulfide isomerase